MASATWSLTKMDIDVVSSALGRLIGEPDFTSLARDGEIESVYIADVAHRLLGVLRGAESEIDRLFS